MNQLAAVNYIPAPKDSVKTFTFSTKRYFQLPDFNSKRDIIDAIQMAIPTFCHKDTGKIWMTACSSHLTDIKYF